MNLKTRQAYFDRVIDQLGGMTAVAILTKRSLGSVCNWRRRGVFPAVLADDIRLALILARKNPAPPELFRMEKNVSANADAA